MLKPFTLVTAALLAATTLSAQAQFVSVEYDGVLSAKEIETTNSQGGYHLVGKFTNPRGFGDYGLMSVYVADQAGELAVFVAGTVQDNGNALQVYFSHGGAGAAGVPVGTALPGASGSGTSFEKMTARLDLPVYSALALRNNNGWLLEQAQYDNATTGKSAKLGDVSADGNPVRLPDGYAGIGSIYSAYRSTTDGKLSSNPGYHGGATAAGYGGAGSYGWEFQIPVTALVSQYNERELVQLFVLQNNGGGDYLSTDFIPQNTTAPADNSNLGDASKVNFNTIPGNQAFGLSIYHYEITLGTRATAAALGLGVYPNPARGAATVSYRVAGPAAPVRLELLDLLGRPVRVLAAGTQAPGPHEAALATTDLPAGSYLLRVQVGDNVAVRQLSVQ